jgi:hypothetical protein
LREGRVRKRKCASKLRRGEQIVLPNKADQAIKYVNKPIKMRMATQSMIMKNNHSRAVPIVSLFISQPLHGWSW